MNRGTLATLRDLVPIRGLTQGEALRIAELQADRFLKLAGVHEPPVPDSIILNIPKIRLKRMGFWPVSGATDWVKGTWVIVINGHEPPFRQRFTLAHEFKHILDSRFIEVIYPPVFGRTHRQRTEAVCDYFAGCLLMPRPWLKAAWCSGNQDIARLANQFQVSQAAMQTRLLQVGLIDPSPRCDDQRSHWRYQRVSHPIDGVA